MLLPFSFYYIWGDCEVFRLTVLLKTEHTIKQSIKANFAGLTMSSHQAALHMLLLKLDYWLMQFQNFDWLSDHDRWANIRYPRKNVLQIQYVVRGKHEKGALQYFKSAFCPGFSHSRINPVIKRIVLEFISTFLWMVCFRFSLIQRFMVIRSIRGDRLMQAAICFVTSVLGKK